VDKQFPAPEALEDSPRPVRLEDVTRPVRLVAFVAARDSVERIEIISNGEVIGSAALTASHSVLVEHTFRESGWVAVRCWGTTKPDLYPHVPVFAHTSPVWVEVADRPFRPKPSAVAALQREIAAVRHWVESAGRFTNPRRKEHLLSLCDAAAAKLAGQS
jgi:hypothetical protein